MTKVIYRRFEEGLKGRRDERTASNTALGLEARRIYLLTPRRRALEAGEWMGNGETLGGSLVGILRRGKALGRSFACILHVEGLWEAHLYVLYDAESPWEAHL